MCTYNRHSTRLATQVEPFRQGLLEQGFCVEDIKLYEVA